MKYDRFQLEAIEHINSGHSVIVSAPTGAGKTVIAEHVIEDCLNSGKRAIYTAPIKALSNQKFRDFQVNYHDKIGILTGDVSINPHAPILIMTTEIFRNKVLSSPSELDEYSWIIFDEIHYIDNYERGTVWEESLMFLPKHMKMLALSATIPNIDEFASWIQDTHQKTVKVIKEDNRPVPLHFLYQAQGKILEKINRVRNQGYSNIKYHYHKGRRFAQAGSLKQNRLSQVIRHLIDNDQLPCIYFSFSRRRCEYLADEMHGYNFLTNDEKHKIAELYKELCDKYELTGEKSASILAPLIKKGIAYHHAGMLPTLKEVVERLFTSRLIKIIFTTETFALGINMPARTVVFDELRKFYGWKFANLQTRDFYQMAGRAGRRGIDDEGFVYTRINPNRISFPEVKRVIFGEPEKVRSRFDSSYATILNLYNQFGEKLYDIYPLSFHYYQEKKNSRKRAVESMKSKVNLLKDLGYIGLGELTAKGNFASSIYGHELLVSELYDSGELQEMPLRELGVLVVALVHEPRKGASCPKYNKKVNRLKHLTDNVVSRIHRREKKFEIKTPTKDCHYNLSPAVEAWLSEEPFETIVKYTDVDEGAIIRNFRMSVQILREILDTPSPEPLKKKIHRLMGLINRDIIDAEKQLRER